MLAMIAIEVPLLSVLLVMTINAFEMWYVYFTGIYFDSKLFKLKVAENTLFLIMEIILFMMILAADTIQTNTFIAWGYIMSVIGILIVITGGIQVVLISSMKYMQMKGCLLYTSPSPRDLSTSRMPSSA